MVNNREFVLNVFLFFWIYSEIELIVLVKTDGPEEGAKAVSPSISHMGRFKSVKKFFLPRVVDLFLCKQEIKENVFYLIRINTGKCAHSPPG